MVGVVSRRRSDSPRDPCRRGRGQRFEPTARGEACHGSRNRRRRPRESYECRKGTTLARGRLPARRGPVFRTFVRPILQDAKSTQRGARKRQDHVQARRQAGHLISFCLKLGISGDCSRCGAKSLRLLPTPGRWPSALPFLARLAPASPPRGRAGAPMSAKAPGFRLEAPQPRMCGNGGGQRAAHGERALRCRSGQCGT